MDTEGIYEFVMMASAAVGAGSLLYMAAYTDNFYGQFSELKGELKGLREDLKKNKRLEDKAEDKG